MDSTAPAQVPNRRRGIRIWVIIAVACLIAVFIAIFSSKKNAPQPNFVWLDQAQFARQMHAQFARRMHPGRLKRLYYKVVNFTAPVWQHFSRPRTRILINSKILAFHGLSTGQPAIGAPFATNEIGEQVWLLSPAEMDDLRQRLKTASYTEVVYAPSVTMEDGMPGGGFAGYAHPQTLATIGVSLELSPKIVAHQFQLALNAVYSDENDDPAMPVRTNISAACRVMLQNAGGVLITSPLSKDLNGTNYWLILSPTAIDGYGKPIKL